MPFIEWAQKAVIGECRYQDYYFIFDNREIPDMFEQTMPEIFPESDPGNFTWNAEMQYLSCHKQGVNRWISASVSGENALHAA